jgi:hypothetical protein
MYKYVHMCMYIINICIQCDAYDYLLFVDIPIRAKIPDESRREELPYIYIYVYVQHIYIY